MTTSRPGFQAQPITTRSAAEQIAEQLRAGIKDGSWALGERLPTEQQLAETYNVSRGTIREALRFLSSTNMVETTRGATGGTFVALPQPDAVAEQVGDAIALWFQAGNVSLSDVDHARNVVERECVRLAATHRTEADLVAIRKAVEDCRNPEMDEWLAADLEFHIAVSRAARNAILELAMTAIHMVRPRTNTILISALESQPVYEQHLAIYEAIRDGDPEAAVRAFAAHFDHLSSVQAQALGAEGTPELAIAEIPSEDHPARIVLERRSSQGSSNSHPDAGAQPDA